MNKTQPSIYKLFITYDGTRFCGWQVQPNATSIQTHVQKALSTALGENIGVTGSGRTDSGVHALAQVAHFSYPENLNLRKLQYSLNGLLPIEIRILSLEKAAPDFHARYSALGKIYRYHLRTAPIANPFNRLYSYHFPYPIDRELLKQSAKILIGTHDFTSFSNESHRGSAARDAVRTLKRLDVLEQEEEIHLEFEANGFLYKMVRNITGTLLDIARGYTPLQELPIILEAKDRKRAGAAAPAHGLFLVKVVYSASNFNR